MTEDRAASSNQSADGECGDAAVGGCEVWK